MRILMLGSYGFPIGGTAVHVQRLADRLVQDGHTVRIIDLSRGTGKRPSWVQTPRTRLHVGLLLLQVFRTHVVHVHDIDPFRVSTLLAAVIAASVGKPCILTVHALRRSYVDLSPFRRVLMSWALKLASKVIIVEEHLEKATKQFAPALKPHVLSGFLPPSTGKRISNRSSSILSAFLKEHHPVMVVGTGQLNWHENVDLYGLDHSIEVLGNLVVDYPNIGLLMVIADLRHPEYLEALRKRADELNVSQNLRIVNEEGELWPYIEVSDVFLRPTNSDGHPLSIDEALSLGVPVVASDAAPRCPEVHVHKTRDVEDMARVIREVLETLDEEKEKLKCYSPPDNYTPLVKLFECEFGKK